MTRKEWGTLLQSTLAVLLLAFSLGLGALPSAVSAELPADRVHPALAQAIATNPTDSVRVVVLSQTPSSDLSARIVGSGGQIKRSLDSIGGYSVELRAADVPALATAPDVRWLSLDAPMVPTELEPRLDRRQLANDYPTTVGAAQLWGEPTSLRGAGVTVGVLDSGINDRLPDLGSPAGSRVLTSVKVSLEPSAERDSYGHGTHVAGIIASAGTGSGGKYAGVAPEASLVNVQVSDRRGVAYVSDVIAGLEWVLRNRESYGIRVVNLSLVSSVPESYLTSPLDAAVELLWLSGIVVVVSAGNLGPESALYPPANDPFVITVGAADTNGTPDVRDDAVPAWSSRGVTQDGFAKPELVAPGRRIVSNLASRSSALAQLYPDRVVDRDYLRLSGTSMSAAVVSGVVALVRQAHPDWTPDQVKSALLATARPLGEGSGRGEVDALAAVRLADPGYANEGVRLGDGVASVVGATSHSAATWNAATWNAATWNAATWNATTWNAATWNAATWNAATWNAATWNAATWNSLAND